MPAEEGLFDFIRRLTGTASDRRSMEEEIWRRFGRRCAVMVIDSSGFTRSTRDCGIISCLSCIVRFRDVMREVVSGNECIAWRFESDNVFTEFPRVENALHAAYEARRAVRSAGIEAGDGREFEVCTGIGFGEVLCSLSEGVFGYEMNLASKLGEDIAGPGEILLTGSAHEAVPAEERSRFVRMKTLISGMELEYFLYGG